jgi:hypothetical protein
VHVFAPASYIITSNLLIPWYGGLPPTPGQTRIDIQSGVAGDLYHAATVQPLLSSNLVLLAPWILFIGGYNHMLRIPRPEEEGYTASHSKSSLGTIWVQVEDPGP